MDFDGEHAEPVGVIIRALRRTDLDRIVRIDQALGGRNRSLWFEQKLARALESPIQVSLGAEVDGTLVGAVLGSVHFGEFGLPEPIAVLDTILVDRAFGGRGLGRAMLEQLLRNLGALRIERLRTEVGWNEQELIGFLARSGFAPVPRLVLERTI